MIGGRRRRTRRPELHLSFDATVAVNQVAGANPYALDARRHDHSVQGASEGLLSDVGMPQDAHREHAAFGRDHLPAVRIVLPSFVGVLHRHDEAADSLIGRLTGRVADHSRGYDVGLAGVRGRRAREQAVERRGRETRPNDPSTDRHSPPGPPVAKKTRSVMSSTISKNECSSVAET